MRIVCISDLHGTLPDVPECDLLLIAGDVCPVQNHSWDFQQKWLRGKFRRWCDAAPARRIVGTWGNHDLIAEHVHSRAMLGDTSCSWFIEPLADVNNKATFLIDNAVEFDGLRIYGSPWQLEFFDWAFNLTEEELAEKYAAVPHDTDILITHGPPLGHCDMVAGGNEHLGSPSLLREIKHRNIRIVVTGHIHTGHGRSWIGDTEVINASLLDERYELVFPPEIVEI